MRVVLYIVSLSSYSTPEDHCQSYKNSHKHIARPPWVQRTGSKDARTDRADPALEEPTDQWRTSKQTLATKNGKCSDRREEETLGEKERTTHPAGGEGADGLGGLQERGCQPSLRKNVSQTRREGHGGKSG